MFILKGRHDKESYIMIEHANVISHSTIQYLHKESYYGHQYDVYIKPKDNIAYYIKHNDLNLIFHQETLLSSYLLEDILKNIGPEDNLYVNEKISINNSESTELIFI